jgi:probable HAF family extracellular repeat protein
MKTRLLTCASLAVLFAATAIPAPLAAQDKSAEKGQAQKQHSYQLIDMGTLGGSETTLSFAAHILNNRGMFGGQSDTSLADPYYPNFNPFIYPFAKTVAQHAALFRDGTLIDLGGNSNPQNSGVSWLNNRGHAVGVAENGLIDPLTGYPEVEAVLWRNGKAVRLGNLGGNETLSVTVNDRDEVAGFAANAIPDDLSFFGWGTQSRAFAWQNGAIQDLGTLGGPDALAVYINNNGQIAGMSYLDDNPNPDTGIPTLDPFLWQNGQMLDLGSLGGTLTFVTGMNNHGQVIGEGFLAGNAESHPFLWSNGAIQDLGSLGGSNAAANWINEKGEVVGGANLPGDVIHHAFLWRNGTFTDLGMVPGDKCSTAWSINSKSQVVGASGMCGIAVHAFLWDKGEMIDLNSLVPPGVQLTYAVDINDRGDIVCLGRDGGHEEHDIRAFLLVPSDGNENVVASKAHTEEPANRALRRLRDLRARKTAHGD